MGRFQSQNYGADFNESFIGMGNFLRGVDKDKKDEDERQFNRTRMLGQDAMAKESHDDQLKTSALSREATGLNMEESRLGLDEKRTAIKEKKAGDAFYRKKDAGIDDEGKARALETVHRVTEQAKVDPGYFKVMPEEEKEAFRIVRKASTQLSDNRGDNERDLIAHNNIVKGAELVKSLPAKASYFVTADQDPLYSDFLASLAYAHKKGEPYYGVHVESAGEGQGSLTPITRNKEGKLVKGTPIDINELYNKSGANLNTGIMLKRFEDAVEPIEEVKKRLAKKEAVAENAKALDKILTPEFRAAYGSDPEVLAMIEAAKGGAFTAKEIVSYAMGTSDKKLDRRVKEANIQQSKDSGKAALMNAQAAIMRASKDKREELELKRQTLTIKQQEARDANVLKATVDLMKTQQYADADPAKQEEMITRLVMNPDTHDWVAGADEVPAEKNWYGGIKAPAVERRLGHAVPKKGVAPQGRGAVTSTTTTKKIVRRSEPDSSGVVHVQYSDGTMGTERSKSDW